MPARRAGAVPANAVSAPRRFALLAIVAGLAVLGLGNRLRLQVQPTSIAKADEAKADAAKAEAAAPMAPITPGSAADRAQREATLRGFLTSRDFTAEDEQDSIIAYMESQDTARQRVYNAGFRLLPALGDKGNQVVPEAQAKALLNSYQAALDAYEAQRKSAMAALETKLGTSKNVRLHATLLILGALDGPVILPVWPTPSPMATAEDQPAAAKP